MQRICRIQQTKCTSVEAQSIPVQAAALVVPQIWQGSTINHQFSTISPFLVVQTHVFDSCNNQLIPQKSAIKWWLIFRYTRFQCREPSAKKKWTSCVLPELLLMFIPPKYGEVLTHAHGDLLQTPAHFSWPSGWCLLRSHLCWSNWCLQVPSTVITHW